MWWFNAVDRRLMDSLMGSRSESGREVPGSKGHKLPAIQVSEKHAYWFSFECFNMPFRCLQHVFKHLP